MTNDSGSSSSKCGCGSGSGSKKDPCPSAGSDKKSGFSKSPCKTPSDKGKCHDSHEKFKTKNTDNCSNAGDSKGGKCSSSYREFTKSVGGESPCGGGSSSRNECQDSYKRFQESTLEGCSDAEKVESEQEQYCKESQIKSVPCPAPKRPEPCSVSQDKTPDSFSSSVQGTKRSCQSEIKKGPCSSSVDLVSKKKESPCASKQGNQKDASLYSKITSRCKNMTKDYVKPKSKTKCSGVDESLQKASLCSDTTPTNSKPCPPKAEKGVGYVPPCCGSKATCSEIKAPSWADFFPLDARNQKLNACIEKYAKIEPGQVISKCSQFANKTMDTSKRCMEQVQETQRRCLPGVKASEPKKSAPLISTRSRVLMTRWAPSAAVYLATSALITLYLTEWKSVPFVYQDVTDGTDKDAKPS